MGVKLVSSSGGSVELVAPTTASNFTQTVPAQAGTVLLKESTSGMSVPAFSAWQSVSQNLTSGVATKLQFQTEEWDTANCYDNATNYRFTPNVAGYYNITASVRMAGASGTGEVIIFLFKNGSNFKRAANQSGTQFASNFYTLSINTYVYLNGSTDYIEIYAQQTSGVTVATQISQDITWVQGALVRAA